MRLPNSAVKRGWSQVGIKWRFETGEELPAVIPCGCEDYVLRADAKGRPIYVHEPNVERDNLIRMARGWPLR